MDAPTSPAGRPAAEPDPYTLAALVAAGDVEILDADPGVPVAILRLAGRDRFIATDPATPPTLGALLLGRYTRIGQTVVTPRHDGGIEGVCAGGGRRYVCVARHGAHAALDDVAGRAALVVGRWPLPGGSGGGPLGDLLRACARLAATDGTVVLVATGGRLDAHLYMRAAADLAPVSRRWCRRPASPAGPAADAVLRIADHIAVRGDIAVVTRRLGAARRR